MTKHSFIFNGKSSLDYGIIIATHPESRHAERRGKTSTIPGRHGALYRDEAAFSTYEISYDVLLDARNVVDMYHLGRDLSAWLLTANGYCRLEDTYEPEHYRLARYIGSPDVANILFKFGRAELEFEVLPQRYLKSGEQEISLPNGETTLHNPTAFVANPLIRVDIDASLYPEPEEAKEITEVELEWDEHKAIGNKRSRAETVHRPFDGIWYSMTSKPIILDGYEKAVINAQCYGRKMISGVLYDLGYFYGTCYTLLDENGDPVRGVYDTQKMEAATVNIPENAKYLVIASACIPPDTVPKEILTPSVTLYPAPSSDEKPGAFSINGVTVDIVFTDRSTVYLDCDRHDAYYADGSNANAAVSFKENGNSYATFPQLGHGNNLVTIDGTGVTATIRPRWWTL